jgi:hypothetical protein
MKMIHYILIILQVLTYGDGIQVIGRTIVITIAEESIDDKLFVLKFFSHAFDLIGDLEVLLLLPSFRNSSILRVFDLFAFHKSSKL